MKKMLIKIYRKLPLSFRKKIKNLLKKDTNKDRLTIDDIVKKSKKYDIVSFDIFDTLITRCIYEPDDAFKILGNLIKDEKFIEKRKKAEQQARKKLEHDVNLDEIYDEYMLENNLSKEKTSILKNNEIKLEKDLLVPRKEMCILLKKLKEKNKKVILVSDMYLTKKAIIDILNNCGYKDLYDALYLSCDVNKRKDSKTMWTFLKKIHPKKKILHLGDNDLSDVQYPKEFGIDTLKIYSSKELLSKCSLYPSLEGLINDRTLSDSILLGLVFNNKIFNSPFADLSIDSLENFAYSFHAPIITEFLKFVIDSEKDNLLFLAREGYYFCKLYKEYCKLNKIEEKNYYYFLASRKATNTATINGEDDVYKLLNNDYNGSIHNFVSKNFNIDIEENYEISLPQDYDKAYLTIKKYIKEIMKSVKSEKSCYIKYIKELIPNYKKEELNVIDLGYSGSIQYNLSKLLDKHVIGYYLTNSSSVKKYYSDSKLNFYFDINDDKEFEKIYHYSLILEYFLTAPYGQLQRFIETKKGVKPEYNEETLDETKKASLKVIYDSIIEYFKDINRLEKYLQYYPSKRLLCRIYVAMVESGIISTNVKDKFDFTDAYCSDSVRNVFKIISRY